MTDVVREQDLGEKPDLTERDVDFYGNAERTPMYYKDTTELAAKASNAQERHRGSQKFHAILRSLGDLHDQKQRDYGSKDDPFANVRASSDFGIPGWVGTMVRANDKMKRIQKAAQQVTSGEAVSLANEGLEDSLMDLAVYAIIALVLYQEPYVGP